MPKKPTPRKRPTRYAKQRAESISASLTRQMGLAKDGLAFSKVWRNGRAGKPVKATTFQETKLKMVLTLNGVSMDDSIRRAFSLTEIQQEGGWLLVANCRMKLYNSRYDTHTTISLSSITQYAAIYVASINAMLARYGVHGKFDEKMLDGIGEDDSDRFNFVEELLVTVDMYIPKGMERL